MSAAKIYYDTLLMKLQIKNAVRNVTFYRYDKDWQPEHTDQASIVRGLYTESAWLVISDTIRIFSSPRASMHLSLTSFSIQSSSIHLLQWKEIPNVIKQVIMDERYSLWGRKL